MKRALFCAVLATGCLGDVTPTEIFVCYSIDPAIRGHMSPDAPTTEETATLGAEVCIENALTGDALYGCGGEGVPLSGVEVSQGVVGSEPDKVRVTLTANVVDAAAPPDMPRRISLSQSAIVAFVEGQVLDLSLRLEPRCANRTCNADQTCVDGNCTELEKTRCPQQHGFHGTPDRDCDARFTRVCNSPTSL